MKAELILIIFFGLGFLAMGILYYLERNRYNKCNFNRNFWRRKYKNLFNKYN